MNEYATDEFCDLFKKFLELNVRGEGRLDIYAFLLSHEGQVRWSEIRENFSNYATGTSSTALFDLENCGLIKCVSIKTENGLVSAYEITDKGKLFGPIILPEKEDIEKVLLSTFIVVLEKIQKGEPVSYTHLTLPTKA